MKQILTLLLGAFLCLSACQKTPHAPTTPTDDQALSPQEAMAFFEAQLRQDTAAAPPGLQARNKARRTTRRKVLWQQALTVETRAGAAVTVPIALENTPTYLKKGMDKQVSVGRNMFLFLYRDGAGAIRSEVLTYLPDKLPGERSGNEPFSGTLLIEDWDGDLLKLIKYKDGKSQRYKPAPSAEATARMEQVCEEIDWYTCVSTDGGNNWTCHYDYTQTTCVTIDIPDGGGDGPGDGDYGGGGGGDGGDGSGSGHPDTGSELPYRWPGDIDCHSFQFKQVTNNSRAAAVRFTVNPSFGGTWGAPYREFPIRPIVIDIPMKLHDGTDILPAVAAVKAANAINMSIKTLGMIYGTNKAYLNITTAQYETKFLENANVYLKSDVPGARISIFIQGSRPGITAQPSIHKGFNADSQDGACL